MNKNLVIEAELLGKSEKGWAIVEDDEIQFLHVPGKGTFEPCLAFEAVDPTSPGDGRYQLVVHVRDIFGTTIVLRSKIRIEEEAKSRGVYQVELCEEELKLIVESLSSWADVSDDDRLIERARELAICLASGLGDEK
jgi:hypothetical protein